MEGRHDRALLVRARRPVCIPRRADPHADEGAKRTITRRRSRPFPGRRPARAARFATRRQRVAARSPRRACAGSRSRTCASRASSSRGKPLRASRDASPPPSQIMLEGPIGAASFNNEFGRPNLAGYFRAFETRVGRHHPRLSQADHDRRRHRQHQRGGIRYKSDVAPGALLVQLGGPGMLIGMGGGAASSQGYRRKRRGPGLRLGPARQRRDAAARAGGHRPLLAARRRQPGALDPRCRRGRPVERASGAGRISPGAARSINLRALPNEEPGMTPRELWCNEAQERYVLAIAPERLGQFRALCERERCPFAVVGDATGDGRLVVEDPQFGNTPVDMELSVLLGKPPRMTRDVAPRPRRPPAARRQRLDSTEAVRPRAAAPGGGRQDVSRHHRRPHRGRTLLARPDGRPVAGARRRLRRRRCSASTATRARRLQWASARRSP